MSIMSNQSFSMNDVKKAGTNSGEDISPGRCPTEQQSGPGRHRTTAKGGWRRKQSQEVNGIVMECYYRSNPEAVGYRDRVHMIWKEKKMFDVKEQRLLDQKCKIVTKKWFSDLELNEIKEMLCHVVLEDTRLNQDRYSNNNECEVVTRLALKHGTVLQGDVIEIFEQLIKFV